MHASPNKPTGRHKALGVTLGQVAERYCDLEELRVRSQSIKASTLETKLYNVKNILDFMGSEDIGLIDQKMIEGYKVHRKTSDCKNRTINSELSTLKLIFKFQVDAGELERIPMIKWYPIHLKETDLPTPSEMVRIINAMPVVPGIFIQLIAETGCRKGEAQHLLWENVDLQSQIITVTPLEGEEWAGNEWDTKNIHSVRHIPIAAHLVQKLSGLPKRSQFVFPGRKDPSKPIDNCRKSLATAIKKAGVLRHGKPMHINNQMLRQFYATQLARAGTDESVLQNQMGHSKGSRTTRKYYIQADKEALRETRLELPFGEQAENDAQGNLAIFGNGR
jgi:integrase